MHFVQEDACVNQGSTLDRGGSRLFCKQTVPIAFAVDCSLCDSTVPSIAQLEVTMLPCGDWPNALNSPPRFDPQRREIDFGKLAASRMHVAHRSIAKKLPLGPPSRPHHVPSQWEKIFLCPRKIEEMKESKIGVLDSLNGPLFAHVEEFHWRNIDNQLENKRFYCTF